MNKFLKFLGISVLTMTFVLVTEALSSTILFAIFGNVMVGNSDTGILNQVVKYQVIVGQLLRLILICIFFAIKKKREPNKTNNIIKNKRFLADSWKMLIIGVGVAGFGNLIISFLLTIFGNSPLVTDTLDQFSEAFQINGPMDFFVMIIGMVILAPIVEEILFRGIVFERFTKIYKLSTAIILDGLLFGIYHMNILQGINTFFMGMVLAFVYYYRRNITDVIIIHMVNNFFALTAGFDESYTIVLTVVSVICILLTIKFLNQFKNNGQKSNENEEYI